jgi:GcrA cell cycle regulator
MRGEYWGDDRITRLRALWAEGLTTAEIGRRLGITKAMVCGKAHRLQLPRRPSPIKPGGVGEVREAKLAVERRPKVTLASVEPEPAQASAPVLVRRRESVPCCWPLGEPRTLGFGYCDAPTEGASPYCAAHCAVAYLRVDPQRKVAA